jgi:FKBP-type peptidyl-prolyl cis-trans isomerase FkpA
MTSRLAVLAALALLSSTARADAGSDYAAKAAAEKGAVKTASGLVYKPIVDGKGPQPTAAATVKVNYRGTFIDGKVFDASQSPISFPLRRVIKCWTEGVQRMRVGGKAQLVCPPSIAYGPGGMPGAIPPNSTLVFEVELLEIVE